MFVTVTVIGIDPDLFRFATLIEGADIPCMIVGAVAVSAFGEPRSTLDIDLVVACAPDDGGRLASVFDQQRYYVPPLEVIRHEMSRRGGTFNIIDGETSLKADIYPIGADSLNRYGMEHRIAIDLPEGGTVFFAPPTCIIGGKLRYYAMSQQAKHLRDIRGILRLSKPLLDMARIDELAKALGLENEWQDCVARPTLAE